MVFGMTLIPVWRIRRSQLHDLGLCIVWCHAAASLDAFERILAYSIAQLHTHVSQHTNDLWVVTQECAISQLNFG